MKAFQLLRLPAVLLFATGSLPAQPASRTPNAFAPIGLLRLKDNAKPAEAAPLAVGKFSVDDLSLGTAMGATKVRNDAADYLALDAGTEWSRPVRGSKRDVTFVSFQLYGSQTTIVEIAGARLGLTRSPATGALQLMFDDSTAGAMQWKSFKLHFETGKYSGRNLAALPTLTVRIEPEAGVWDIFSGSRLLADNLPLIVAKRDDRRFVVRAGTEGAWISGLVLADENPLYEDANANAIDDRFEKEKRGALLSAQASVSERKLLAQQWKDAQRKKAPPALRVSRPKPDATIVSAPPKK